MVGWHHQLDGPEFELAPGGGDEQGSLVCCCPWGLKESDRLTNRTELNRMEESKSDTQRKEELREY